MELSDKLKAIQPRRLQQVVAETEYDRPPYPSFDALCEAVAAGTWATNNHIDKYDIGALIVHHKTAVKIDRPAKAPERPTAPVASAAPARSAPTGNVTPKVLPAATPTPAPPPVAPKLTVVPAPAAPVLGGPKPSKYRPAGSGAAPASPPAPAEAAVPTPEPVPEVKPEPVAPVPLPEVKPGDIREATAESVEPPAPKVRKNKRPVRTPGSSGKTIQRRITIPAGKCPVELKATDEDSVRDWAEAVRQKFEDDGLILALSGLIYFARYYTSEPDTVIAHLKSVYVEEAGGVVPAAV